MDEIIGTRLTRLLDAFRYIKKTFSVSPKGDALHQTAATTYAPPWPCLRIDDHEPITGGMKDDDRLG